MFPKLIRKYNNSGWNCEHIQIIKNTEYLRIKALVDLLISIGHLILEQEHILEGFPIEYDAFVTLATFGSDPYKMLEIESFLLNVEATMEKHLAFFEHS